MRVVDETEGSCKMVITSIRFAWTVNDISLMDELGTDVPSCFIVVCKNTSTFKLVYDYIPGCRWSQPVYICKSTFD